MKKTIVIISVMLFSIIVGNAQEKAGRPATIRLGGTYTGVILNAPEVIYNEVTFYSGGSLCVDASWINLTDRVNWGAYLELGKAATQEMGLPLQITPTVGMHYGVHLSYHLFSANNTRWDISLRGLLGSYWCPGVSPQSEYGVGVNVTFYPFERLGIFVESLWGKHLFNGYYDAIIGQGNTKLKFGISYRLP